MIVQKHSLLKVAAALMALSYSCGKPLDNPSGKPDPEPEPPVEESLEVLLRETGETVSTLELDFFADSRTLMVISDVEWDFSVSVSWIIADKDSRGTSMTVVPCVNSSGGEREGSIRFMNASGDVLKEVEVRQKSTSLIAGGDFSDMMFCSSEIDDNICNGYLSYSSEDGPEWMFDAYCLSLSRFDGILVGSENSSVTRQEYEYVIKEYLDFGKWLSIIDSSIAELRKKIAGEYIPRKVIIAIPETSCTEWGEIDGVMMNTKDSREDKVKVACWFVDRMLEAYALQCSRGRFSNLQLIGFYWQQENGNILPEYGRQIADHIHGYGLKFYWVPYFNAYNYGNWADYGFDMAWLQPNYLFNSSLTESRLYETCSKAAEANMGVEVEWDSTKELERHVAYWDVYEELGILDSQPLTYYDSGNMITYMENMPDGQWKDFYTRVAGDIVKRQHRFYEF